MQKHLIDKLVLECGDEIFDLTETSPSNKKVIFVEINCFTQW